MTQPRAQTLKAMREIRRLRRRILDSPAMFRRKLRRRHLVFGTPMSVGLRIAAPFRCLVALFRWGPRARRVAGTPLWRQLLELLHISLRWRHEPRMYYVWELYREGRLEDAPLYVDTMQNVEVQFAVLPSRGSSGGKHWFHDHCGKHGLRTVPVLATCSAPGDEPVLHDPDSPEWAGDLYEKPTHGQQGRGIRRWSREDDGGWWDGETRVRSREELLAVVRARTGRGGSMIQPRRFNHEALSWVPDGPISTIRIVTLKPVGGGKIEFMPPWMRIPKAGATVDNLHQGGLPAPVDLATGRVGRLHHWAGVGLEPGLARHPDSSELVEGVAVPFWEQALELCRKAQEAFHSRPSVGWDVGIDADGPFLLEMNGLWGCDLLQALGSPPFGLTPWAEIMLGHLRERSTKV